MQISLVVPCFNAQETLQNCLESAINQTIPFFEIILVDNHSKDNSIEVASKFKQVKILSCNKQSAAAARNFGWRRAQCSYIAFVDADTVLEKDWTFHIINLLKNTEVIASQSKIIPFLNEKNDQWIDRYRFDRKKHKTKETWIELDLKRNITAINTAACIYKKNILVRLNGFEENLFRLEDTDLALKARYLGKLAPCKEATAHVYYDGNSLSYLYRSFKDGKSQVMFNYLWGINDSSYSFELVTNQYKFFETLNFLAFKVGYLVGLLVTKKSAPKSLKITRLIQKIDAINL